MMSLKLCSTPLDAALPESMLPTWRPFVVDSESSQARCRTRRGGFSLPDALRAGLGALDAQEPGVHILPGFLRRGFSAARRTCSDSPSRDGVCAAERGGSRAIDFSLFFWNAQTLCNTDFGRSKTKAHWFANHAKRHTVSALVETHGTALEIDLALAELSSTHIIPCNPHHDRSVGGTCGVVAKSFLRSGSGSEPEVVSTCIVPGRVQMVEILLREGNAVKKRLAVMVVHHFKLSKAEIRKICDMLDARAAASRGDPNAFQLWLAGDFNFPSRGELLTFAHDPHELMAAPTPSPTGGESDVPWRATLARLTEIGTDLPTHFTSSSNRLQRIDRIYYAQPSWLTVKQQTQARVVSDPVSMHARLLSDHPQSSASTSWDTMLLFGVLTEMLVVVVVGVF